MDERPPAEARRILLHACCGPCATAVHRALVAEDRCPTAFWYNPNIHPYREYERRLATLREYAAKSGLPFITRDEYDLDRYLRAIWPETRYGVRCRACYRLRLTMAAREAKAGGFEAFTTTLLISPRQFHEVVREEGERAGAAEGAPFIYRDFRPLWRESIRISKDMGLYRQPYCGCVFSESERYRPGGKGRGRREGEGRGERDGEAGGEGRGDP